VASQFEGDNPYISYNYNNFTYASPIYSISFIKVLLPSGIDSPDFLP